MAKIGNTQSDPIPLCLLEHYLGAWKFFAMISLDNIPTLFASYSITGISIGMHHPIPLGMHTRLAPVISYYNLMVGEQQLNYDDPTKWSLNDFHLLGLLS